jgi:hypothetical protein
MDIWYLYYVVIWYIFQVMVFCPKNKSGNPGSNPTRIEVLEYGGGEYT